jgi:hypothetical protein
MPAKQGKPINLGIPDPSAAAGGPPPPGMMGAGGPPAPSPLPGDGGGGPPPGDGGGAPGGPPAPSGDLGAGENMNYPELHIAGLPDGSGLEDLPEEGHARIHYKVTSRGKEKGKGGKEKGKTKHHASLEVHHIQPEGDGKQKESEADGIRKKAQQFFQAEDQGARQLPGGAEGAGAPGSEMPG